ncbi:MAG: RNA polymerase sigma factor [Planctomycetota bacterium]
MQPLPMTHSDPEVGPSGSTVGGAGAGTGRSAGAAGAGEALGRVVEGPSDHDLVRRAQAGEEDAFQMLVERHQQRAFRVARQMVPNREDALDLAQEAFLRVFRSLERFDFKHEFTTWLYRIVTNLAIDHLRKRRPVASGSAGDDDEAGLPEPVDHSAPAPSDGMERAEVTARVRECIDSLAPHFRSVLALRELEGLPCTEIARIVGATHVTVRWRLHRGRKLFQEEWERRERSTPDAPDGADAH